MNRLQAELERLFGLQQPGGEAGSAADRPPDTQLMVLEIRLPNAWDALSAVWQAVQADLGLPAPAIAVSGIDSYQLWFSVRPALARSEARLFLQGLCQRYLAQLPAERVRMFVDAAWSEPTGAPADCGVPPTERSAGCWSAFVAPDLAGLFAEEPWLDMPPSADAQADLLARLQPARPADLRNATTGLVPGASPPVATAPPPGARGGIRSGRPVPLPDEAMALQDPEQSPRGFLLAVMNDPAVDLSLRIAAAQALLPYCDGPARPG